MRLNPSVRKPQQTKQRSPSGDNFVMQAGGLELARALYIVIQSQGKWWVDFEGRSQGPHDSREGAALEARNQAQFMAHMNRPSEVLVPDADGRYWVVWDSRRADAGIPKSVSAAA